MIAILTERRIHPTIIVPPGRVVSIMVGDELLELESNQEGMLTIRKSVATKVEIEEPFLSPVRKKKR